MERLNASAARVHVDALRFIEQNQPSGQHGGKASCWYTLSIVTSNLYDLERANGDGPEGEMLGLLVKFVRDEKALSGLEMNVR